MKPLPFATMVLCTLATAAWAKALPEPEAIVEACSPGAEAVVVLDRTPGSGGDAPRQEAGRASSPLLEPLRSSGLFDETMQAWNEFLAMVGIDPEAGEREFFGGRVVLVLGSRQATDSTGGAQQAPADPDDLPWVVATDIAAETGRRVRRRLEAMPRRTLRERAVYTVADGTIEFMIVERADGRQSWLVLGSSRSEELFDRTAGALLAADDAAVNPQAPAPGQRSTDRTDNAEDDGQAGRVGLAFWRGEGRRVGAWEVTADLRKTPRGLHASVSGWTEHAPTGSDQSLPAGLLAPANVPIVVARVPVAMAPGALGSSLRGLVGDEGEVLVGIERREEGDISLTFVAPVRGVAGEAARRVDRTIWQLFALVGSGGVDVPNHDGAFPGAVRVQRAVFPHAPGSIFSGREVRIAWKTDAETNSGSADDAGGSGAALSDRPVVVVRIDTGEPIGGVDGEIEALLRNARGGRVAEPGVTLLEGEAGVRETVRLLWPDAESRENGWAGVLSSIDRLTWRVRHTPVDDAKIAKDEAGGVERNWRGEIEGAFWLDFVYTPPARLGVPRSPER